MCLLTVVGVPDTVLQHGVPLGLLLLRHDAEVVVPCVRVPQDQGELGGTLHKGTAAGPRLHPWDPAQQGLTHCGRSVHPFIILHP